LQGLKSQATVPSSAMQAARKDSLQKPATGASVPADKPASAAIIYYGVGVIESISEPRTTVQINHQDIKDLMPAMTMPFEVKSPALLDQLAPGDRIRFTLEETPHGLVIIEIHKR